MNSLFPNKVLQTWKHALSAEKNAARIQQMQFCKAVKKNLVGYEVTFYFNPGGPAVWGETYIKVSRIDPNPSPISVTMGVPAIRFPVVEACLSVDHSYIRQWDGKDSGRNHSISYTRKLDPAAFAMAVLELERRPFRRF